MSLTDWQMRQLDEQFDGGHGPAVGGITWATCLARTTKGPCLTGVPVVVNGEATGKTKCDRHDTVDAMVADVKAGILVLASVYGLPVTDEMATDRANNIVHGIVANYDVRGLA